MEDSLKHRTLNGIGWSFVERFSIQGVNFVIQLILARILTPADYGVIAMLAIFLQIAQVFVESGFANALIKKQDCCQADYSTVFFYNLGISIVLYWGMFFCAPLIASFYNEPLLIEVTRVIALSLIFNALSIVQKTILVKRIDFHSQTKVTFTSAFVSGSIGILMACYGFGVWSLVGQTLINSVVQIVLLNLIVKWHPSLVFSKQSFKDLFGFGSKLLLSSLIHSIYSNIYSIVIGKKYTAVDLGYYTRAEQFAFFPSSNIGSVINRVAYPVLSKLQDDDKRLINVYRKIIKYTSYIIFPLMLGLFALSSPLISVVLTDKWADVILYLKILCFAWMIDHLSMLNLNVLYVKGRSDLVLRLEVIKKTIAILILIISLNFGIIVMCLGRVLYGIIAVYINSFYTKRLLNLSFIQQMRDVTPYLATSIAMMFIVSFSISYFQTPLTQLMLGVFVGMGVYLLLTFFFHKDVVMVLKEMYYKFKLR